MKEKRRVNIYLPDDLDKKIDLQAERLGLSRAKIALLAISAGIDALTLATNPDWKAYFEAIMRENEEKRE